MINKLPSGLIQDVSSSEAFVVGDQKVCTLSTESFLALQQTFWNTNNDGKKYFISKSCCQKNFIRRNYQC